MSAVVIAICNQKGGVGKTTTVFHLADALRRADAKVLCVDLDPQGNLTSILVREALEHDDTGVADALSGFTSRTLSEVVTEGLWTGVDIAPTAPMNSDPSAAPVDRLASVRDELVVAGTGRERRLKEGWRPSSTTMTSFLLTARPRWTCSPSTRSLLQPRPLSYQRRRCFRLTVWPSSARTLPQFATATTRTCAGPVSSSISTKAKPSVAVKL